MSAKRPEQTGKFYGLEQERQMNPMSAGQINHRSANVENIVYVQQMLGELRYVGDGDGAEMLRYLIEMAYVEAGDLIAAKRYLEQEEAEAQFVAPGTEVLLR